MHCKKTHIFLTSFNTQKFGAFYFFANFAPKRKIVMKPFNFKANNFENLFEEALRIARETPEYASEFLQSYASYILEDAPDISTMEDAIKRAKTNIGYHAGRFDRSVVDLMYEVYDCEHPYFGKRPYDMTPWQVVQKL